MARNADTGMLPDLEHILFPEASEQELEQDARLADKGLAPDESDPLAAEKKGVQKIMSKEKWSTG